MKAALAITLIGIFGQIACFSGEATANPTGEEQIASLQRIAMVFDGGSIQFRFTLSSGSSLEVILNDQAQVGMLPGVPEHSAADWWLWLVKDKVRHFLSAESTSNQKLETMLDSFLRQHDAVGLDTRRQLQELKSIVEDRKRRKVSYDFWIGFNKKAQNRRWRRTGKKLVVNISEVTSHLQECARFKLDCKPQ